MLLHANHIEAYHIKKRDIHCHINENTLFTVLIKITFEKILHFKKVVRQYITSQVCVCVEEVYLIKKISSRYCARQTEHIKAHRR